MRWRSSLSPLWALSALTPSVRADYSLEVAYQGDTFFNGWNFYGNRDNLTNGAVYYVAESESSDVAYTNSAGNVIIKVDNETTIASGTTNALRNSVRITTKDTYDIGSLFVMDALHVPYGCATWPAFWVKAKEWPSGGELDIYESVNMQQNQIALHTVTGCFASNETTNSTATGSMTYNNCAYNVAANHGCTFEDSRNSSFGEGLAAVGGGLYVAELASDGISVWWFPRSQVPLDLRAVNATPDPRSWSLPTAYYPSSSCNINQYFAPQQITINIALCGSWAGEPGVFSPSCGTGSCADYVLDPSHFDEAYFEIASVRVYSGGLNTRSSSGVAAASGVIGAIGGSDSATSRGERAWSVGRVGALAVVVGMLGVGVLWTGF
ncbi:concanavalin A-like lectin/glucanase domain-containing protein [Leucosporidium creatinivorum]|uniref:Concanavalin A-like lectin/glucanase domain-containing protein n=1 Tax=Leucosporidium creatinivorum TaxID=106004 RepID=A0A1Y2G2Y6_9BASI|nr:concanavalin A-like lectin/glucanase domain-containing protein [Leucosporidium creatinivorum]